MKRNSAAAAAAVFSLSEGSRIIFPSFVHCLRQRLRRLYLFTDEPENPIKTQQKHGDQIEFLGVG